MNFAIQPDPLRWVPVSDLRVNDLVLIIYVASPRTTTHVITGIIIEAESPEREARIAIAFAGSAHGNIEAKTDAGIVSRMKTGEDQTLRAPLENWCVDKDGKVLPFVTSVRTHYKSIYAVDAIRPHDGVEVTISDIHTIPRGAWIFRKAWLPLIYPNR